MITVYPFSSLGQAHHGWLDTHHHFSFAHYYNPQRLGFGVLRVINDDVIKAGAGFDMHPHKDMEIITYVRKGAITHRDNQGNVGRTTAGDVQVMSAGTGVFHSEYNLENEDTQIYQIWIEPKQLGVKPRWQACSFPEQAVTDTLPLLVSGQAKDNALFIYQDAAIYAGRLLANTHIQHSIQQQAYILVSAGEVEINQQTLKAGDGAEIKYIHDINIKAVTDAEALVIDVPPENKFITHERHSA